MCAERDLGSGSVRSVSEVGAQERPLTTPTRDLFVSRSFVTVVTGISLFFLAPPQEGFTPFLFSNNKSHGRPKFNLGQLRTSSDEKGGLTR